MMREDPDTVIRLTGITVEKSDETVTAIDLGFCQPDTCTVDTYSDNFGKPGSFVTVTLPASQQNRILELVKSGSLIIFHYTTSEGSKRYTLGLKGSHKAIERLERKHGLSSGSVGNAAVSQRDTNAYQAALRKLQSELTLVWSPKGGHPQAGRQTFSATTKACVFNLTVHHPNTGKTTQEFNLGHLDPNQITWEEDSFFGIPSFFTAKALGNREVAKLWTNYPDGTDAFEREPEVSFYIGKNGNFDGIKPHLETAIRYCNRLAQ